MYSSEAKKPTVKMSELRETVGFAAAKHFKKANPFWGQTTLKLFPGCIRRREKEYTYWLKFWKKTLHFLTWESVEMFYLKNKLVKHISYTPTHFLWI